MDILVFSDSDTNWEPGLLREVLAPFKDPEVGGVGTRQNAYLPKTSVWRRIADWMIDVRYLDYVPAQARAGAVACLSGRTAAYRRKVVLPVLETWKTSSSSAGAASPRRRAAYLAGARLRVQDRLSVDRPGPFHVSRYGPRVFQAAGALEQNSYRCYFTAMWKGWLWRQPFICQLSVLQIMLTPVTMGFAVSYLFAWVLHPQKLVAVRTVGVLLLGRGIRGISHLRQRPSDIFILPLVAVLTIIIALPIKSYALLHERPWLAHP